MPKSNAYCPKCFSKSLILTETLTASTSVIQKDGIIDRSTCNNEYGDPFKVEALCDDCGYEWKIDNAMQITDILVDSEDVYIYNGCC
ncbi:MAG: hypothetical protein ACRC26_05415 [Bacteroidales bacterium]